MPIYLYQNPESLETKEIIQSMSEPHEYYENGVKWVRVFTVPNASIDTKIDAFSQNDYVNKTSNKKGTVGDLLDLSSELSRTRKEKTGEDKVKKDFFKNYEKQNGIKHMNDRKESISKNGFNIQLQ